MINFKVQLVMKSNLIFKDIKNKFEFNVFLKQKII